MNTCVQAMFALPWRRVGLVESSQYDHFNGVFASVFNKVHTFFERKLIWDIVYAIAELFIPFGQMHP